MPLRIFVFDEASRIRTTNYHRGIDSLDRHADALILGLRLGKRIGRQTERTQQR